ncbi:beta-glucosidase 31 isoform X1 [Amborella trichopoda]|uniref:Beta-glucosidase n=2 Tax=Amborella trichopoda TaxID=13333 RepID=W1P968_AMBTC|nr:beta-glucosidase 31 isoform X1 [Amborella trichopoda]ERN06437.1 hypothetical protein AMTR_s00016p00257520 [Amborella trichopoda]|eukprot:XP_006844762.1 beta-glucosidase 31 isoform X1 [Amborella trichopoda]
MERPFMFLVFLFFLSPQIQASLSHLTRDHFPPAFLFGAGTSSLQVEGAAQEDGKKPSIEETFPDGIRGSDKLKVAADQYHKYKEDVKLMHEMGLDAYRFSIAWSRLIPDGRGAVNPLGLKYYNSLLDELHSHGIAAHVTLYHFDLPQSLQDEYGGWVDRRIIEDFTAYAEVCFREFGDRVVAWSTFNEPNFFTLAGYDVGLAAPYRCSIPSFFNCSEGNSSVDGYLTAHNVLLSHANAVQLYRERYQPKQGGSIGLSLMSPWFLPATNSSKDVAATQRVVDFQFGWFMDPLVHGDYPLIMRRIVGSRLPTFGEKESKLLKSSIDFIGLNHYTIFYVHDDLGNWDMNQTDYITDVHARVSFPGVSPFEEKGEQESFPSAMSDLLEYFKQSYKDVTIFIHENGLALPHGNTPPSLESGDDDPRVQYLQGYLDALLTSIRNGSNVEGYFVWSFVDCFEFAAGKAFGLYYVDFEDANFERYPTPSSIWYSNFLHGKEGSKVKRHVYQTELSSYI